MIKKAKERRGKISLIKNKREQEGGKTRRKRDKQTPRDRDRNRDRNVENLILGKSPGKSFKENGEVECFYKLQSFTISKLSSLR